MPLAYHLCLQGYGVELCGCLRLCTTASPTPAHNMVFDEPIRKISDPPQRLRCGEEAGTGHGTEGPARDGRAPVLMPLSRATSTWSWVTASPLFGAVSTGLQLQCHGDGGDDGGRHQPVIRSDMAKSTITSVSSYPAELPALLTFQASGQLETIRCHSGALSIGTRIHILGGSRRAQDRGTRQGRMSRAPHLCPALAADLAVASVLSWVHRMADALLPLPPGPATCCMIRPPNNLISDRNAAGTGPQWRRWGCRW